MSTQDWPVFVSKLVKRFEVAEKTMGFCFDKPENWNFKAGQFIDITLLNPSENDEKGNTRGFSISSAPQENYVMVTTRLTGSVFKRVLSTVPLGFQVRIEGPFGNFVLHNNVNRPAVFISGGIGITPFRSILISAAKAKLPHKILLIFVNHSPKQAPFLEELSKLQEENPNYKMVAIITGLTSPSDLWSGLTGHLTKEIIAEHVKDFKMPIYYIAGPAGMVKEMRKLVNENGVDDDDIRTEEFPGY